MIDELSPVEWAYQILKFLCVEGGCLGFGFNPGFTQGTKIGSLVFLFLFFPQV